jgi:hypothetical protein
MRDICSVTDEEELKLLMLDKIAVKHFPFLN